MIVVYYTSAFFLDVMLETIQTIKYKVDLHVFIEISENSKNATLLNVNSLNGLDFIEDPVKVIGEKKWEKFKPYFDNVKSVQFIVYKNKKSFSFLTIFKAFRLGFYLKKLNYDVIHFDNLSLRLIGLYPFVIRKKICINIHDPISHTGEENWRDKILNVIFIRKAKALIFYSQYSLRLFNSVNKKNNKIKIAIPLKPYSFINKLIKNKSHDIILFFGRISYYKGIDIFLRAIPIILLKYPNELFVLLGQCQYNYTFNKDVIEKYNKNILWINEYCNIDTLADYISKSKFIVCPYREATQSGVIMTAFGAKKSVIATNVGSFSEYIMNDKNGLLSEPEIESIANSIMKMLDNKYYTKTERHLVENQIQSKDEDELYSVYFKI